MKVDALYFTATWCQPCKVFGPEMDKLSGDVNVVKLDIEEHTDMLEEFGVQSVPTVVIMHDGREAGRFVGARTEEWVRDFIKQTIN